MEMLDKLLDENNQENIMLYGDNGAEVIFEKLALIHLDGVTYAILNPVTVIHGITDEGVLVFALTREGDEPCLEVCEDESVLQMVLAQYNARQERNVE